MTGPSGGPGTGGSGLPDLKQPPGQIEGAGGGPALPAGPSVSKEDKATYDEISDELNYMAAGWAGGTVIAGATGVEPAAIMMGLASAGCWWLAQDFNDLSDDPPQAYQEIVRFQRRAIAPPGIGAPTPGLAAIGIALQYTFFGGVTVQGALMAAERLAGATAAGDYDWAVTHRGVLLQASGTIPTDLALIAAAHRAAGLAIEGTGLDGDLTPGPTGVGQWIASPGSEASISRELGQVGLTDAQTAEVIAWWRSNPPYGGRPSTLSKELVLFADRLYHRAERLAARV